MIPARAYASTAIGGQYGSAVECAVETLGVSWGSLTADQQSYLFNVTTSTDNMDQFAVFRNSLHEFTPSSGLGGNAYYSTLEGSMYAIVATNARRQLSAYLSGSGGSGGSGGGSSGGGIEPSTTFTLYAQYTSIKSNGSYQYQFTFGGSKHTFSTADTSTLAPETVSVTISQSQLDAILGAAGDNDIVVILGSTGGTSQQPTTGTLAFYFVGSGYTMPSGSFSSRDARGIAYTHGADNIYGKQVTYVSFDSTVDVSDKTLRDYSLSTSEQYVRLNWGSSYYGVLRSGSGGGGGSTPEPEPDPTPVQPVNPTGPTITGPTINVNTGGNNSSTTTVDLTPILEMLRIINDNIVIVNGNITDFETWFYQTWQNYVDWLQLWFERFGLSLDNIYAQQELVGNNIVDELREIEDVLWNIFYKPDPEYPTSTPYDDTQLQGILNGMWADNNGYLNAIQNLLMQISGQIDGLDDVYTPHVGTGKTTQEQLNEDVARLKRKFPFSIPWDLYALLQFLQAPPAAPTFSFTLPYMGTLQCDLSVFDDVAAVCRWVSLLWFVAGLLACTNKLLNLMNVFERND